MQIEIVRNKITRWGVDGEMFCQGRKVCDTAENSFFALPTGFYWVRKARRGTIGVYNREGELLAKISTGDGVVGLPDGRIVVGKALTLGVVIRSRTAYGLIYERCKKSWRRKHGIELFIREEY